MRRLALTTLVALLSLPACSLEVTGLRPDEAVVVVENRTSTNIVAVYISECSSTDRGENRLAASVIVPDDDHAFDLRPGCYDVVVQNANGSERAYEELPINGGQTRTLTLTG